MVLGIMYFMSPQKSTCYCTAQYFCTLSHSQQSVQAATQHVNSTVQKYSCMSFHWSGGIVTVVKHKMWHSVHECQYVTAIRLIYKWQKITKNVGIPYSCLKPAVSLFHCLTMGVLLSFVYIRQSKHHNIHFLHRCPIYLYVVFSDEIFQRNSYMLAV